MKFIFLLMTIGMALVSSAQFRTETRIAVAKPRMEKMPEWIDTTNMKKSRYGDVARLTQDNMPCLLPFRTPKSMPAASIGTPSPKDIPNLWKGEPGKCRDPLQNPFPFPKNYTGPKR